MLLEGADYKIRYVENLPSTVHCFVAEDSAGFFNIYVNANLAHDKIMVARVREFDFDTVSSQVDELIDTSRLSKPFMTVKKMKQLVPEYISNNSIYEQLDPQ